MFQLLTSKISLFTLHHHTHIADSYGLKTKLEITFLWKYNFFWPTRVSHEVNCCNYITVSECLHFVHPNHTTATAFTIFKMRSAADYRFYLFVCFVLFLKIKFFGMGSEPGVTLTQKLKCMDVNLLGRAICLKRMWKPNWGLRKQTTRPAKQYYMDSWNQNEVAQT